MRHDPNNSQCDKVMYAGADDIKCTCDIDSPEDAPAPSTLIPPALMPRLAGAPMPSVVALEGREAASYCELKDATRDLDAARKLLKPAEERWRKALDALHEEILR